jgi:RNA polymerase sigma-70 factor, ECF subfamily
MQSAEDLLSAAVQGDSGARATLVSEHLGAVRRLAHAILGDRGADDATQETFARALSSLASFDSNRGNIRAWLLGIVRLVSFEQLRSRTREAPQDDIEVPLMELAMRAGWGVEEPEAACARAEAREQLARAISQMSPTDREILVLRDLEGLSGSETAQLLGIDLTASKSRLHRARLHLAATLRATEQGVNAQERNVSGMTCSEVLAVLSDYVDGDASCADRARIETHLRECSVCARFGGHFSRIVHNERLGATEPNDALLASIRAHLS